MTQQTPNQGTNDGPIIPNPLNFRPPNRKIDTNPYKATNKPKQPEK